LIVQGLSGHFIFNAVTSAQLTVVPPMTTYCFADTVASKVISYFKICPPNGKPKSTAEAASEFTVLASIVATRKRSDALGDSPTVMTVISIATVWLGGC
jgi:hypothetical protein